MVSVTENPDGRISEKATNSSASQLSVISALLQSFVINTGGALIGKRTFGKGTDSLNNEIDRINEGLIKDFGTLAGVLTKEDHQKLQSKIDQVRENPISSDNDRWESTRAKVRLVSLQNLNKQQQISDTIKEYGFDPSKTDETDEEKKRLKAQSLRGQMTSMVMNLEAQAKDPLDKNNSAMLGRVFCFAISCGGFEVLELIGNFIDCFVDTDFRGGVEKALGNPNVIGPVAKISDGIELDKSLAWISDSVPIINDINQTAVTAMNSDAGLMAVEGYQALAASEPAKYALIAVALTYQAVQELSINSDFNKSIKQIKEGVDKFRDKIRDEKEQYYKEAANDLAEKKEFNLALRELELKQFINNYQDLDKFDPSRRVGGDDFKDKFKDILVKFSDGKEVNVIDLIREKRAAAPSQSNQKILGDVIDILASDTDTLEKFMTAVSKSLLPSHKEEAQKELMREIMGGQSAESFQCLKQYIPTDGQVNYDIFEEIKKSQVGVYEVLKELVAEVKNPKIYQDIVVGDSFFQKLDLKSLKTDPQTIDSVGGEVPISTLPPMPNRVSSWEGDVYPPDYVPPPPPPREVLSPAGSSDRDAESFSRSPSLGFEKPLSPPDIGLDFRPLLSPSSSDVPSSSPSPRRLIDSRDDESGRGSPDSAAGVWSPRPSLRDSERSGPAR